MPVLNAGNEGPILGIVVETTNSQLTRCFGRPLDPWVNEGAGLKPTGQRFCVSAPISFEAMDFQFQAPCAWVWQDNRPLDRLLADAIIVLLLALAFLPGVVSLASYSGEREFLTFVSACSRFIASVEYLTPTGSLWLCSILKYLFLSRSEYCLN